MQSNVHSAASRLLALTAASWGVCRAQAFAGAPARSAPGPFSVRAPMAGRVSGSAAPIAPAP